MTDLTSSSSSGPTPSEALPGSLGVSLSPGTSPSAGASASASPGAAPSEAHPPRPTFDVLPLSRELRETLAEMGYLHPTPVQLAVWEPATRGKDAVVQARTGTGKTAAFGLPIVDHLVRRSLPHAQVLTLVPTRELAVQVAGELERLSKRRNVKILSIYGGAPMPRQVEAIAAGAQVIVGTPGRVLDHLRRGTLDPKHIRLLVLDESDEMLSMGFERELTSIIEMLPKERQTLLFSATVPPDIERIAKTRLKNPEFITLSGDHVGALSIVHHVYMVAGDKLSALVRVLEVDNPESAVIFCNTKDETERVSQTLTRQGFDADWLNGDLPQPDREKVMSATREGRLRFLVATDVAARGIDISHLTHVINFDFPQDAESYIHRTGRTGRAGRTGTAISMITPRDVGGLYLLRLTYKIRPIEKQIPTEGELKTRAEADLVAMLAEAFLAKGVHPDDLSLARRLLTHDQSDLILAGLLRDHLGARPAAKEEASAARRAPKLIPPPPPPAMTRPVAPPPVAAAVTAPLGSPRAITPAVAPAIAPAAAPAISPVAPPLPVVAAPVAPALAPNPAAPAPTFGRALAAPGAAGPLPISPPAVPPRARQDAPAPPFSAEPRGRHEPMGRDAGPSGGRRREGRGREREREEHIPVSAADGSREGVTGAGRSPQRHADFITWQPPAEEGDDDPILGEETRVAGGAILGPRPRERGERERVDRGERGERVDRGERVERSERGERVDRERGERGRNPLAAPAPRPIEGPLARPVEGEPRRDSEASLAGAFEATARGADADFAEIFVNVGRREGARAADLQRILTERAGIDKANVRRIRVRERNAFVSVRREELDKALVALTGVTVAGKVTTAEPARERAGGEGESEGLNGPFEPGMPEGPAKAESRTVGEGPAKAEFRTVGEGPAKAEFRTTGEGPAKAELRTTDRATKAEAALTAETPRTLTPTEPPPTTIPRFPRSEQDAPVDTTKTFRASASAAPSEPPTAPRAPDRSPLGAMPPLTDFRGEGQAPIDPNASVTSPGGAGLRPAAELKDEGDAAIGASRVEGFLEDARGGMEQPPTHGKPG